VDRKKIKKILQDVRSGKSSVARGMEALKNFPYEDLGFAKIDSHRDLRKGFPEVIFCRGKKPDQIARIFRHHKSSGTIMATKAGREVFDAVRETKKDVIYYEDAGIILAGKKKKAAGKKIVVVSAGTSDIPVAEEAAVTAEIMGSRVERIYDIGAAGIHRMLSNRRKLQKANVVIVTAGMDGVLPSIIGGVVSRPVIAVPTSVGYGANFKGLAALLTALNSCAPGVAAVNIDNGFGAGYMAALINRK